MSAGAVCRSFFTIAVNGSSVVLHARVDHRVGEVGEQVSGDDGGHLLATLEVESRWVRVLPTGGETREEHCRGALAATRAHRRRCTAAAANRLSARTTIRVAFGASRFGKIPSRAIGAVKWKSV